MKKFVTHIISLVILLLSVVWLCRDPSWGAVLTVFVSFTTHIAFAIKHTFYVISPHDEALAAAFINELPSNLPSIRLLKDHDFAAQFEFDLLKPFYNFISEWTTAEKEFDDKDLSRRFRDFYSALKTFTHQLAMHSWPSDMNPELITMEFRDLELDPLKLKTRKEINDLATSAYAAHQQFIREIRNKNKHALRHIPRDGSGDQ